MGHSHYFNYGQYRSVNSIGFSPGLRDPFNYCWLGSIQDRPAPDAGGSSAAARIRRREFSFFESTEIPNH
jgi:hypothetical protein